MRHLAVRAELLDEHLGVDAELLDGLGLQLLDPRHLAGPGHLVAVGGVGEVAQLVLDADQLGAQGDAGLLALEAVGLGGVAQRGRAGQGGGDALDGVGRGLVHGGGHGGLAAAALPALAQPLAGGQLVAGGALERVGPALERAGALLAGAQGQPQLGLGGAGPARGQLEPVALVGGGVLALLGRRGLGLGQPRRQPLELGAVALEREARLGDGRSVRSASADAWRIAAPRPPSCSATAAIRASDSCSASRAASTSAPTSRRALAGRAQREPGALGGGGRGIQRRAVSSTAACSSSRLSPALLPPRAQPGPKTSPSAVTAVMPSARATRATAWAAVGTSATRSSSCSTAGRTESGARTTSRAHTASRRAPATWRGRWGMPCAHEQRGAPAVVVAQ